MKNRVQMRWKHFAAIGVLMIFVLIGTAYIYLRSHDYNAFMPRIVRIVKDATGRKLSLDGEIDLTLGLRPSLVFTDMALSNASGGLQPQMIEIERLQAQVQHLPLLFKDVAIKSLRMELAPIHRTESKEKIKDNCSDCSVKLIRHELIGGGDDNLC